MLGSQNLGLGSVDTASDADQVGPPGPPGPAGGVNRVTAGASGLVVVAPNTGNVTVDVGALFVNGISTGAVQLSTLPSSNFNTGQLAWVNSVGAYFALQQSALTVDGITVVAATGKGGSQWQRVAWLNLVWQAQLTWSVDPQNSTGTASDENTGVDDAHALLTMRELQRRVAGSRYVNGEAARIVRLLSSMNATDGGYFDVLGSGTPAFSSHTPFGSDSWFTIVGVPTVVYTGTIAAPSQTAQGGNGDNHFTDAGAPTFSTANRIWHRTTGNGGYFWPMKDQGGGTFRISLVVATFQNVRTLTAGDAWQIQGLPTLNNTSFPYRADAEAQYQIALVSENSATFNAFCNPCRWVCVQFALTSQLQGGTLNNCRDFFITFYANRPVYVSSGGLLSTATAQTIWDISELAFLALNGGNFDYLSLQGIVMQPASSSQVGGTGGSETGGNLMFYDCTGPCLAPTGGGCNVNLQTIGGSGNSSDIVNVARANTAIVLLNAPPAAMTSAGTPINVRGSALSVAAWAAAGFLTDSNRLATVTLP